MNNGSYQAWPALPYHEFKQSAHLLHMGLQAMGKLKLATPFEPHWANVALWLTSRGVSTGLIPYQQGSFSVAMDCIGHEMICSSSWGKLEKFALGSMSVAKLTETLFHTLHMIGVKLTINPVPQEIASPIAFHLDVNERQYHPDLVNAWWRILLSSYQVLQRYHAKFTGLSPAIGLMWGTMDLRDARYSTTPVPTTGQNAGYIRRNAMEVAQVEAGWWAGNEAYPQAAYFSFTYPPPHGIEKAIIQPASAHWNNQLSEFILNYDDVRQAKNPEQELLTFLESSYQAGAQLAGWQQTLISEGEPV